MSKGKGLVSIVVPVYNVGRYLPRCLDSIAAQTYDDIEVIMVDDGSTDPSGSICDRYCLKDGRFRVIHQENKWLAEARNAGLSAARGDYVYFVDSDDWIHPQAVEMLLAAIGETGCEIAFGDYLVIEDDDLEAKPCISPEIEVWSGQKYLHHIALQDRYRIQVSVAWNKLIPRKLVQDLRFPSIYCAEDVPFCFRLFLRVESVVFVRTPLYFYRYNHGSIAHRDDDGRRPYNRIKAFLANLDSVPGDQPELRSLVLRRLYMTMLISRHTLQGKSWASGAGTLSEGILNDTGEEFYGSSFIPAREKWMFRFLWKHPRVVSAVLKLKGN